MEFLTSEPTKLWGGFSLVVGPHPSGKDHTLPSIHASKDQVFQFFLTMYKSFVHPLVFIRLLLHRLSCEDSLNLFDWSTNVVPLSPTTTAHLVSVPPTQINVLNVIGRWLELYPDDFTEYPALRMEMDQVVLRLKLVRGPYIPHTHRLRWAWF